ncbi:MAG: GerW family sporulation protein [Defluviitaleaceae bacterium]|nr:GerW family sporulation protein [Defluviitaleaceae bacterium]
MGTEFNNNIATMFEHLDGFVSSKTVVGEPILAGDTTIIPLVDVSIGMGGGSTGADGGEKPKKETKSMGGLGAKMKPSAMLVITNGNVQLVNIKHQDSISKLIDMIPSITNKIDFGNILKRKDKGSDAPNVSE